MTSLLDKYIPTRSPDEPHDRRCQVTRIGPRHCCTCESNMDRRREGVKQAAIANDVEAMRELGSMEQYMWHKHRCDVDPSHVNPYASRRI